MIATTAPAAVRLTPQPCGKPWGSVDLGAWGLGLGAGERIGEIHHVGDVDAPLLFKTLFTTERLSVQVHPDDAGARQRGAVRGKDEAWVVLAAAPGAEIGLGLHDDCDADALRRAADDGSIVEMMRWHACAAGDVLCCPAGTIHAIGGGITLFEIQQNCDITYRLFDYGRDRPLHLGEGLAVVDTKAWQGPAPLPAPAPGRELLVAGASFVLERLSVGSGWLCPPAGAAVWVAVVTGSGTIGDDRFVAGEVWVARAPVRIEGEVELLLAYVGTDAPADLWTAG